MRRTRPRHEFVPAASGKIFTFPQPQPPPRLEGNALRLDQFRRQSEMLAEVVAATPHFVQPADLPKENRLLPHESTHAAQAALQEKGGTIFSTGYSRFHFV